MACQKLIPLVSSARLLLSASISGIVELFLTAEIGDLTLAHVVSYLKIIFLFDTILEQRPHLCFFLQLAQNKLP